MLTGEAKCPPRHIGWLKRTQQLADQFENQLSRSRQQEKNSCAIKIKHEQVVGYLLACAYPDRIARKRHSGGYQLANGRSASFAAQHHLGKNRWLAVAEVSGQARIRGDVIRSAASLSEDLFESLLHNVVSNVTIAEWDKKTKRFVAEKQQRIGALVLQRKKLNEVPVEAKRNALIQHIEKEGLGLLPWNKDLLQWCARINLIRSTLGETDWPNVSEENLLSTLREWLGPYLDQVNLLSDFKKLDLKTILSSQLSWEKQQQLDQLAPQRLKVASGSFIAINYAESPPILAVKLQEMFGCEETPTLVNGKVTLQVHLLSPAGRPLQVTQDLIGFWRTSYHDVKKEMKGRYPKHPWPDDPLVAIATRKTKARQK